MSFSLSVGYGYDGNNKLTNNFGPLVREGGERRLNVLITRAREKCVIFANFKAQDLRIEDSTNSGLLALKSYLEYAENGNLSFITDRREDSDSPFEDSVYEFLSENGYEVHKQVGSSGYRIDLAIENPENPGKYLVGIECDGAKYHSSPVARDRDRLRQQNLEKLGWKIIRIWSTDWYRNRSETKSQLLKKIKITLGGLISDQANPIPSKKKI